MTKLNISKLSFIVVCILLVISIVTCKSKDSAFQRELNLLCWAGYEEPQFLGVFKKKYNVKVNYKTFFGGDGMVTLLNQTPGQYDVVVVDKDYFEKLLLPGKLAELNPDDFDFSNYIEPFKKYRPTWKDGKLYGIVVEYGTSALVYNTKYITYDDVESYEILWDQKVKGKVGIWDWYLPNMGNISLSLGFDKPFNISSIQFTKLKQKMHTLRPQVAAFHNSPSEIISALANEQIWIIPGSGEWLASILKQQGLPIDWAVPKEGGLLWVDTLVIPKDAPHPETAVLYLQWMQSPEAQALLSQKQAFNSNVTNKLAYNILSKEHKDILKVHNEKEAVALISSLRDRTLPVQQSEKHWQAAWEEFKAKKF